MLGGGGAAILSPPGDRVERQNEPPSLIAPRCRDISPESLTLHIFLCRRNKASKSVKPLSFRFLILANKYSA